MAKAKGNLAATSERRLTVTDALLTAIRNSGLSARELSRQSGMNHASISLFLAGKRSLTLPSVDALANVLGLQLRGGKA